MSQVDTAAVRHALVYTETVFPSTVLAMCDELDRLRKALLFVDLEAAVCPTCGDYWQDCECWRDRDGHHR